MNIIDRAKAFVQSLYDLAHRSAWNWRRCPHCGSTFTNKHGSYRRHAWFFAGRQVVRVQRHLCQHCHRTYSEGSAWLVRGSWYAREVHRSAVDHWQHVGTSLRRTAELLRSQLGRQERWLLWRPLDSPPPPEEQCHLSASTVHRWLDRAGKVAQKSVPEQLAGVPTSGQMGTDGLWARLRAGAKRVVLALVDSQTGLVYPPVVVAGEDKGEHWQVLFSRAATAGLDLDGVLGLTSDGSNGLLGHLERVLIWVNHQRCVWHIWRNLGGALLAAMSEASRGLVEAAAEAVRRRVRGELVKLIKGVLDAPTRQEARLALALLRAHQLGAKVAAGLAQHWDEALVWRGAYNRGLVRVAPEWLWRDFRLRLSRGRNHRTDGRLERASLVWAIYRNFTPAQWRSERKRHYRRPGKSPLEMAGVPPNGISYLDALGV